jgi:hypothetical protein
VEISVFVTSKEGQTSLIKFQENVDHFVDFDGVVHHELVPPGHQSAVLKRCTVTSSGKHPEKQ